MIFLGNHTNNKHITDSNWYHVRIYLASRNNGSKSDLSRLKELATCKREINIYEVFQNEFIIGESCLGVYELKEIARIDENIAIFMLYLILFSKHKN